MLIPSTTSYYEMKNSSAVKYHMFFNIMYQLKNQPRRICAQYAFYVLSIYRWKRYPHTYVSKLSEPGVIEVVHQSYSLVQPFATIVDDTFLRISCDIDSNMDPYGQQENDEVTENIVDFSDNSDTYTLKTTEAQSADLGNTNAFTNQLRVVPDDVLNKNISSLNM